MYSAFMPGLSFILKAYFSMLMRCRLPKKRFQTMGSAMTTMSSEPMKIDMTMPGTLSRPSPKVTSPMMKAASTTPGMLPEPPRIETPPSTTMVIASSS